MQFTEEDRRKLMLRFMGLRSSVLQDVARNEEGEFWAAKKGDDDFNIRLGKPKHNQQIVIQCRRLWFRMSLETKMALFERLSNPKHGQPIPLSDFGIEEGNA